LKPDSAITNYNLGMAYFMQNQWEKAEAEWARALALKPDYTQVRQALKVVRQKMGSQ
jgi:Flp pilus assembly protein TadD